MMLPDRIEQGLRKLKQTPVIYQWLAQLAIIALILLLLWYLLLQPRYRQLEEGRRQFADLSAQLLADSALLSMDVINLAQSRQKVESNQQWQSLVSQEQTEESLSTLLLRPLKMSDSRLYRWQRVTGDPKRAEAPQFWQLEIGGRYHSLMLFVQQLLAEPDALLIERAELAGEPEDLRLRLQINYHSFGGRP